MSTEIDELKQARYRSDKTISGHNAFLRPPTGETNSVDTRGFYFVLKEPHPNVLKDHPLLRGYRWPSAAFFDGAAGPKNPRTGQQIFPGYPAGTEAVPNTWATWITGSYNLLCRRHSAIPITVMSYLRIRNGTFVC